MENILDTDQKVKRYAVDLFADKSEIQIMTRKELLEFAQYQTEEWFEENIFNTTDEFGNTIEKYKDAVKLAREVVEDKHAITDIREVELLFSLPATDIPIEVIYV